MSLYPTHMTGMIPHMKSGQRVALGIPHPIAGIRKICLGSRVIICFIWKNIVATPRDTARSARSGWSSTLLDRPLGNMTTLPGRQCIPQGLPLQGASTHHEP